jgi:hypothetical protein
MAAGTPEDQLLRRITTDPEIFGGKPIVRGCRLAVEHVLAMLVAGDTFETLVLSLLLTDLLGHPQASGRGGAARAAQEARLSTK